MFTYGRVYMCMSPSIFCLIKKQLHKNTELKTRPANLGLYFVAVLKKNIFVMY